MLKLLSSEELREKLIHYIGTCYDDDCVYWKLDDDEKADELLALINQQKIAHGDIVIGEDVDEKFSIEPYERIKQHENSAVNRRLAEQRERNV